MSDDHTQARASGFETRFAHISEIDQPALASRKRSSSKAMRALPVLNATCVFFSLRSCQITTACESRHVLQLRACAGKRKISGSKSYVGMMTAPQS